MTRKVVSSERGGRPGSPTCRWRSWTPPTGRSADRSTSGYRAILEEHPKTFVTIVIPEVVLRKWWNRLLHNQTALTLKGTFLFEPSVVVSSVPYRL